MKRKILISSIIIVVLLIIYVWTINIYVLQNKKLEVETVNNDKVVYVLNKLDNEFRNYTYNKLSKQETKDILDNEFKTKYILIEYNGNLKFSEYCTGITLPSIRTIVIKKSLNEVVYTQTLCHELIHLTCLTSDEKFCEYKSFKILYDSDCEYFRYVAYELAIEHLRDNSYSAKYNAKPYITNYLYSKYKGE